MIGVILFKSLPCYNALWIGNMFLICCPPLLCSALRLFHLLPRLLYASLGPSSLLWSIYGCTMPPPTNCLKYSLFALRTLYPFCEVAACSTFPLPFVWRLLCLLLSTLYIFDDTSSACSRPPPLRNHLFDLSTLYFLSEVSSACSKSPSTLVWNLPCLLYIRLYPYLKSRLLPLGTIYSWSEVWSFCSCPPPTSHLKSYLLDFVHPPTLVWSFHACKMTLSSCLKSPPSTSSLTFPHIGLGTLQRLPRVSSI